MMQSRVHKWLRIADALKPVTGPGQIYHSLVAVGEGRFFQVPNIYEEYTTDAEKCFFRMKDLPPTLVCKVTVEYRLTAYLEEAIPLFCHDFCFGVFHNGVNRLTNRSPKFL